MHTLKPQEQGLNSLLGHVQICSIYTTDHLAEGKQFISICWRTKERVEQQAAYQEEGFLNFDVCAPIHQPVSLTLFLEVSCDGMWQDLANRLNWTQTAFLEGQGG